MIVRIGQARESRTLNGCNIFVFLAIGSPKVLGIDRIHDYVEHQNFESQVSSVKSWCDIPYIDRADVDPWVLAPAYISTGTELDAVKGVNVVAVAVIDLELGTITVLDA